MAATKSNAAGKSKSAKPGAKARSGSKKGGRCWPGYEPVPGKKAFSKGSCKKAD